MVGKIALLVYLSIKKIVRLREPMKDSTQFEPDAAAQQLLEHPDESTDESQLRRGKWTPEEEKYANKIIVSFRLSSSTTYDINLISIVMLFVCTLIVSGTL